MRDADEREDGAPIFPSVNTRRPESLRQTESADSSVPDLCAEGKACAPAFQERKGI